MAEDRAQKAYARMTDADRRQVLVFATAMADRLRLEPPYSEAEDLWTNLCTAEPGARLRLLQRLLNSSHLSYQVLHPLRDVEETA